jgi:cyclophilin family peptidyl-prolyl cis-trans isomerase
MGIDPSKRYTATMDTSMGTLVIALDAINAPVTVNNFVFLAAHHYYDGIIFHRIINGFVCQGGDPGGTGTGGPGYRFQDEPVKQRYQLGSVAMANAGPNTNGSQFFLISGPSGVNLPPQYNHFGQIVKGLDVLDAMQRVSTGRGDRPHEDVVINSVTISVAD